MAPYSSPSIASILLSLVVSAGLIGTAYLLAQNATSPTTVEASTETALLQAVTAKDTDKDGLADWEELLYGTDPKNPDSKGLGMKDGEAVEKGLLVPKAISPAPAIETKEASGGGSISGAPAGTLTDSFARKFFTLYIAAKSSAGGGELGNSETSVLATKAYNELIAGIAPTANAVAERDLTVRGSGQEALRVFAESAEQVFATYSVNLPKAPLTYLGEAVEKGDTSALESLQSLSEASRNTAKGLAALAVPNELLGADLALVNALTRLGSILSDFARADSDPLAALFALKQYGAVGLATIDAFDSIENVYVAAGLTFEQGTPGASFVNVAKNVRLQSAQTNTP